MEQHYIIFNPHTGTAWSSCWRIPQHRSLIPEGRQPIFRSVSAMKVPAQHQAHVPLGHKLHETKRRDNPAWLGGAFPSVELRKKAMKLEIPIMSQQRYGSIGRIRTSGVDLAHSFSTVRDKDISFGMTAANPSLR